MKIAATRITKEPLLTALEGNKPGYQAANDTASLERDCEQLRNTRGQENQASADYISNLRNTHNNNKIYNWADDNNTRLNNENGRLETAINNICQPWEPQPGEVIEQAVEVIRQVIRQCGWSANGPTPKSAKEATLTPEEIRIRKEWATAKTNIISFYGRVDRRVIGHLPNKNDVDRMSHGEATHVWKDCLPPIERELLKAGLIGR